MLRRLGGHRDQRPAAGRLQPLRLSCWALHWPAKGGQAPCQHQNCKLQRSGLFRELLTRTPFLPPLSLIHTVGQGNKKPTHVGAFPSPAFRQEIPH